MSARTFTIDQAISQLPHLMELADQGEDVVILQNDRTAARLVPIRVHRGPKQFGGYQGQILVADDFDDPLPAGFWLGELS